jgi:hypothetical protein
VKVFKNFKEKKSFKPDFGADGMQWLFSWKTVVIMKKFQWLIEIFLYRLSIEFWRLTNEKFNLFFTYVYLLYIGIFGGFLLGVSSGSGLSFFDWDTLKLIRRIDIQPTHVYWAENASLVALATSDQYFILKYHADAVANAAENTEDIENAFEVYIV